MDKNVESALAAHSKRARKGRLRKGKKSSTKELDVTCGNCKKSGHTTADCYAKGGGKEGQALWQKKSEKSEKTESAVVGAEDENEMFAFTCTSNYVAAADELNIPKSRLGACVDSGASRVYSPDRSKFTNYHPIHCEITTADGRSIKAIGMGDLCMHLPNGSKRTETTFRSAIHAPDLAFTLISISSLDKAGYSVVFNKGMCTIKNSAGKTIATIPKNIRLSS